MKILFITLTNIGDIVQSTALLDRILVSHPDAQVDIVTGKGGLPLFEGLPNLRKLIPLIKRKYHLHYWDLWQQLNEEEYDLIVDLRTPLLSYFLTAKQKIRFKKGGKSHRVQQFCDLWPQTHLPPQPRVWPNLHNMQTTERKISVAKPYIVIAPTANWRGKQWPQRSYAQLIEELNQLTQLGKTKFVILGAAHERNSVSDILAKLPTGGVDLVGKTDLREAYMWLQGAELFIGNDSGLAHLAAAANTPTITLFGPTPEHLYAPFHPQSHLVIAAMRSRAELNLASVAKPRLISDITVDQVMNVVHNVLDNKEGK